MFRAAARTCRPRARPASYSTPPAFRRTFFWSGGSSSSSSASSAADLASSHVPAVAPDLLPLLWGVVVSQAAYDDDQDEDKLTSPPWEVREFGDKGAGAVASRDIAMGELLIAERPLCIWPQGLNADAAKKLFDALTPREQEVFMQLSPGTDSEGLVQRLDEVRARRATNGFSIPLPPVPGVTAGGRSVGCVFPKIARSPNATQVMNFQTLRMEVYAVRPIAKGQELNIEYLPGAVTRTSDERRNLLAMHFNFPRCLCAVCSASPSLVAQSDARRREVRQVSETIKAGRSDRKATVAKMERIRVLLEEEGYKALPDFECVMRDGDAADRRLDPTSSSTTARDGAFAAAGAAASASSVASSALGLSTTEENPPAPDSSLVADHDQPTSSRLAPSSTPPSHSRTLPHLAQVTGVDRFDADALSKLPPLPLASGLAAAATAGGTADARDAGLRQLAILQSLVARQTAALRDGFPPPSALGAAARGAATGSLSLPPIQLPPPSHPDVSAYATTRARHDNAMPSTTQQWATNLEGLNHVDPDGALYPALGNVTADELLAAQASLDLWSATVFSTNSPATSPPATSHGPPPPSLDWSALYPGSNHHHDPPSSHSLSPLSPFAHATLHGSPPAAHNFLPSLHLANFPPFPPPSRNGSFSGPTSSTPSSFAFVPPARAPSPPQHDAATGPSPSARRSSRANAGAKGRAARAAAAASEGSEESGSAGTSPQANGAFASGAAGGGGGGGGGGPSGGGLGGASGGYSYGVDGAGEPLPPTYTNAQGVTKARELMTPDEVEEDKRRRNTEASARFRAKKKMRDAELKQSSASLRERVASLEKEKES
ncbi:hypothetical protein JCM9279_006016, partial [Rhodotorula babjevae]